MFYNPLATPQTQVVYVIVETVNVQVTDANDVPIPCQINPVLDRSSLLVDNKFQVPAFYKHATLAQLSVTPLLVGQLVTCMYG